MVSVAHMHAGSYASYLGKRPGAELVGVWDSEPGRGKEFAQTWGLNPFQDLDALIHASDALVICSENTKHAELIRQCALAGKPIICEKPLAAGREQVDEIRRTLEETGVMLMTAFPCPFSPTFQRLQQRVAAGEIGKVLAVSATNRGRCPFGWFVEPSLSGGGAMIDHVVHVTDLLRRLLKEDPARVTAQIGNNMYGQEWDDTAHLTIDFPSGVFATLDSSWSRHQNYKTWGDVNLRVTGEKGVIEVELFGQGLTVTTEKEWLRGTGSDLDGLMIEEFLSAIQEGRQPSVTAEDGLKASEVALMGYESAKSHAAVPVGSAQGTA